MKWSIAHVQWCRQCHLLHTLEIKAIVSSDPCFNWPRSPLLLGWPSAPNNFTILTLILLTLHGMNGLRKHKFNIWTPNHFQLLDGLGQIGTFLTRADPAEPFWGAKSWRRGPNLTPFSSFSTDLAHFILKLLNFAFIFYFMLNFKFI